MKNTCTLSQPQITNINSTGHNTFWFKTSVENQCSVETAMRFAVAEMKPVKLIRLKFV